MFTPTKIQIALEGLFDLCDPEKMEAMLENYGEEFDDICPATLCQSFLKNADMVYAYRALCAAGDGMDYHGKALFDQRAVRLLAYVEDSAEDEQMRMLYSKELWLLEDMTFVVLHNLALMVLDGENASCITEYRTFHKCVEHEMDIFFDPGDLVCELDDICLFEQLSEEATIYEP